MLLFGSASFGVTVTQFYAYVADACETKSKVIFRLTIVLVLQNIGQGVGGLIVTAVSKTLSYGFMLIIAQFATFLSFFYGLFAMKNIKPKIDEKISEKGSKESKFGYLVQAVKTLLKPRSGHKRAYIWVFLATYMACAINFISIFSLLPELVFKSPISWDAGTFGLFSAVKAIAETLGLIFGPIFVRYLKCTELTLVM